jgi:hypothetical protein
LLSEKPHISRVLCSSTDSTPLATYSLWIDGVKSIDERKTGAIGHLYAADSSSAAIALDNACRILRKAGCRLAVGPLDGSTWRNYRLRTYTDGSAEFPGEPSCPGITPEDFRNAGFHSIAEYSSSRVQLLPISQTEIASMMKFITETGVTVRTLDAARIEDELLSIFRLSRVSFVENFMYIDCELSEFMDKYMAFARVLDPELVLIAEKNNEMVGYILAFALDRSTVVLKTIARRPGEDLRGLGRALVTLCHDAAIRKGYREAVHALYKHDNVSARFSCRANARIVRRYELFARELTA